MFSSEQRRASPSETASSLSATAAPEPSRALCRLEMAAAVVLSLVAISLHIVFVSHAGALWRDEVNTVNLAGLSSLGEMAKDSFPVLTPLMIRGWTLVGLGASDLCLRGLGLLIGLGLLAALWVASLTTSGLPPRVSLTLFALNSTVVIYGDSLRPYGLGSLLIVLAAVAMWSCLKRPTAWRTLVAAGMAILSVQALFQNSVLVAAICFGGWAVALRRRSWWRAAQMALVAIAAAASLCPYVPGLVSGWGGAAVLQGGFQWARAYHNLCEVIGFPLQSYAWLWAVAVSAIVASGCAALWPRGGRALAVPDGVGAEDLMLFAAVVVATGTVGFGAFHRFVALPAKPWYLLPLLAVVVTCFDAGLPPLPRLVRVGVLGVVLATAGIAVPYACQSVGTRLTNIDVLAQRLAANACAGDYIIVAPWYCGLTFARYYQGSAGWETLPPLKDHSRHRYDLVRLRLQNPKAIRSVLGRMAATLQAGHKVWIVGHMIIFRPGTPSPADLPPAPQPGSGWSDAPYQRIWLAQVSCFLGDHSCQLDQVCHSAGEVNPNEDMELVRASGWRGSPIPGESP